MNREPTDAEVEAYQAAWGREHARLMDGDQSGYRPGDRTRAGLRAVFALPSLPSQEDALHALADTTVWTVETWRAMVVLAQSGWRPPFDEPPRPMPPIGSPVPPPAWSQAVASEALRIVPHRYQPDDDEALGDACRICHEPHDTRAHRIWKALPADDAEARLVTGLRAVAVEHEYQEGPERPLNKVRLCLVCGRPPVFHLTPKPPHQWRNPTDEEN